MSSMWYTAKEVMQLLDVGESTAYKIMTKLGSEISQKKIPGKDICYAKPPRGKIQKSYFCEKYMLNMQDCDIFLRANAGEKAS